MREIVRYIGSRKSQAKHFPFHRLDCEIKPQPVLRFAHPWTRRQNQRITSEIARFGVHHRDAPLAMAQSFDGGVNDACTSPSCAVGNGEIEGPAIQRFVAFDPQSPLHGLRQSRIDASQRAGIQSRRRKPRVFCKQARDVIELVPIRLVEGDQHTPNRLDPVR